MLAAQGDWILFSDADLSAPIEEVDRLLAAVRERECDGAIGSRALNRKLVSVHQSAFREYSGRFFNLVMRLVTGLPYADTQCGFKLFRREAAHAVFSRVQIPGFGFDVEALFVAKLLGYTVVEVPVRWANAEGTKVTMLNGLQAFTDLLVVRLHHTKSFNQEKLWRYAADFKTLSGKLMGVKVHLYLHVKVHAKWDEDRSLYRDIGLEWVE